MKPKAFRQRQGLDTRIVDADAFVITETTIKNLNATAAVVWLLLEEPSTRKELLVLMRELYPDIAWRKISADLGKLLAELEGDGLIVKSAHALPSQHACQENQKAAHRDLKPSLEKRRIQISAANPRNRP